MSLARINVEMVIDPLPVRLSSDNNPREASLLPHFRNLGYGSLPVARSLRRLASPLGARALTSAQFLRPITILLHCGDMRLLNNDS